MILSIKKKKRRNDDDKLSEYSQDAKAIICQESDAIFKKTIQFEI